jgi:hypothetical protein
MDWVVIFLGAVVACPQFYVVGVIVFGSAWYFTRCLHLFPRILLRSLLLALLLAPGAVVGDGVALVPAIVAVVSDLFTRHRPDMAYHSAIPIFAVWSASAILFLVVALLCRLKAERRASGDSDKVCLDSLPREGPPDG